MSGGIKQIDGYKVYLNKQLGTGSYGSVYNAINDTTSQKVAVKIIKKSSIDNDEYLKAALYSQIKIMQSVKSQNIVGFLDVMESSKNYYIVQELCDGDISHIIKPKSIVPQKQARQFLYQISNGFLALVREGIIHRDLKPANIMVKGTTLKLGDFGFAKKTHATKVQQQTIVGTPLYMSPQILKSQPYSSKCDIWALGFIFYEMMHGKTPWTGTSEYNLIKNIQTKQVNIRQDLTNETKDFLRKCLQREQKQRISWDELFVHPIFGGAFLHQASQHKEFENKLKCVMADLRFQINSQNLDLFRILTALGYKSGEAQLDQQKFYQFLRLVNPGILRSESNYIFSKADTDNSGGISIEQIQSLMSQHCINLTSVFQSIPNFKVNSQKQLTPQMNASIQLKVRNCFIKLFHIINNKNKLLYDVFKQFDKEKSGSLDRIQFKRMMNILSKDLGEEQINGAFDLIDQDGSNSIQFDQLNSYFSKVNGIPQHLNKPPELNMDIQKSEESAIKSSNKSNPPQIQPQQIQPMNMFVQPFPNPNQQQGQLQQGYQQQGYQQQGYQQGYQQQGYQQQGYQQNYVPPPQQYSNQPNMYGYQGYNQPPPPQGGFFNNFVMNQIQMGLNQGQSNLKSHSNHQGQNSQQYG